MCFVLLPININKLNFICLKPSNLNWVLFQITFPSNFDCYTIQSTCLMKFNISIETKYIVQ